jgi:hypothetical protein
MAEDLGDDRLYTWTIRTLYTLAIALNVWILWDQVKDSPEGQAITRHVSETWEKLSGPVREAQMFRRHANRVIFEAQTIVEEGEKDADGH